MVVPRGHDPALADPQHLHVGGLKCAPSRGNTSIVIELSDYDLRVGSLVDHHVVRTELQRHVDRRSEMCGYRIPPFQTRPRGGGLARLWWGKRLLDDDVIGVQVGKLAPSSV